MRITEEKKNPLGENKIALLLKQFTVPSIIAMLVSSLYNIVDQLFIGQKIGELGNAATNIAFPLSTLCTATALLFGIGGASAFNISMGEGNKKRAIHYMGNAVASMIYVGICLTVLSELFLKPLLLFFGSSKNVLEYAMDYTRITAISFPFLILSIGGGHLIRADGRPKMTMLCNLTGAIINTILDALFVFGFDLGMKGAALATVIGQFVAVSMVAYCLKNCKTVRLKKEHFLLKGCYTVRIISLGFANCANQLAMMVVQIVMNKTLKYYGARSVYGEDIPIACAGIITKVNMIFMAFVIGLSQGLQPIASFNYGAKKYKRVQEAYIKDFFVAAIVSLLFFGIFQIFPRQIISLFGKGGKEYYEFAINYFHVFLFFTFLNFIQPISSGFFTAIGKPKKGAFLSLTRQIMFLLPLILILPLFFGIDGVMFAGPIADFASAFVGIIMLMQEFREKQYKSS